jgi:hypothetical protein
MAGRGEPHTARLFYRVTAEDDLPDPPVLAEFKDALPGFEMLPGPASGDDWVDAARRSPGPGSDS